MEPFFWLHLNSLASQQSFSHFVYAFEQVLHQRLDQRGDSWAGHTQDQIIDSGMEASLPGLPQRENTMIGGDSQQEVNYQLFSLMKPENNI